VCGQTDRRTDGPTDRRTDGPTVPWSVRDSIGSADTRLLHAGPRVRLSSVIIRMGDSGLHSMSIAAVRVPADMA
jgi:hypothetical protein